MQVQFAITKDGMLTHSFCLAGSVLCALNLKHRSEPLFTLLPLQFNPGSCHGNAAQNFNVSKKIKVKSKKFKVKSKNNTKFLESKCAQKQFWIRPHQNK